MTSPAKLEEMQRCMDMLADVPGDTLESRITKYIGSFMEMQIRLACPAAPRGREEKELLLFVAGLRQHEIDLEVREEIVKKILALPAHDTADRTGADAPAQAEPETYRETVRRIAAAREKRLAQFRDALESIAAWRQVNTQGEFEHGLRDIIRSITDCAAAALETSPLPSQHHHTATE